MRNMSSILKASTQDTDAGMVRKVSLLWEFFMPYSSAGHFIINRSFVRNMEKHHSMMDMSWWRVKQLKMTPKALWLSVNIYWDQTLASTFSPGFKKEQKGMQEISTWVWPSHSQPYHRGSDCQSAERGVGKQAASLGSLGTGNWSSNEPSMLDGNTPFPRWAFNGEYWLLCALEPATSAPSWPP